MAKWTGKFRTKRTWYGATKFFLEWYDEAELGEPFWEELDKDGMHCLEFQFTGHLRTIGTLMELCSEAKRGVAATVAMPIGVPAREMPGDSV